MKNINFAKAHEKADAINQAVLSYKEIKAKITYLENELKTHKEVIEEAAKSTENGSIIREEWKVVLTIAERESFSLKNAKAVLGEATLKPFISTSTYTVLRVS